MIKELDEFDFHPTITDAAGLVIVFFTGPHCASCHHLRDLFTADMDSLKYYFLSVSDLRSENSFSVFEVRADKAGALVNEFSVFHLPTMFLFQNGNFHCELQAQAHPQKIIEAIEQALKLPAEEEP